MKQRTTSEGASPHSLANIGEILHLIYLYSRIGLIYGMCILLLQLEE